MFVVIIIFSSFFFLLLLPPSLSLEGKNVARSLFVAAIAVVVPDAATDEAAVLVKMLNVEVIR